MFELNAYHLKRIAVALRDFSNNVCLELFLPSIEWIGVILPGEQFRKQLLEFIRFVRMMMRPEPLCRIQKLVGAVDLRPTKTLIQ
jgi:hypothetical protein